MNVHVKQHLKVLEYHRLRGLKLFRHFKSLQDLQKTLESKGLDFTLKPLSHNEPNHLNTN